MTGVAKNLETTVSPETPSDALGEHSDLVRDTLVAAIRHRHTLTADGHRLMETRYGNAFGAQWRDLLSDSVESLASLGFDGHKLFPAGYRLPIVNDSLIYVWRMPDGADPSRQFATSPTRRSGFTAHPRSQLALDIVAPVAPEDNDPSPMRSVISLSDTMPLVLVMISSTPRQLRSITWAVATIDSGAIELHGQEVIWQPEPAVAAATSAVEPFDSGTPTAPVVELRPQQGQADD